MIANTKQAWEIGQRVKVGFMALTVHSFVSRNDPMMRNFDGSTDGYVLINGKGVSYLFRPHNGLTRLDN